MEERVYTLSSVVRLLMNYATARSMLMGGGAAHLEPSVTKNQEDGFKGMRIARQGVSKSVDGKRKASAYYEIFTAVLDVEAGLRELSPIQRSLLIDFYIYGDYTYAQLRHMYGFRSEQTTVKRVKKALEELVEAMNG